jgi:succinate dehydrogenase / fumarate reductase cytochrome b subunit
MSSSPRPGDASNDPTTDQTGRFVRQPNGRIRPLSPHLQVWRWHVTMLGSILHRVSGGALVAGAALVLLWLAALACGPDAYAAFTGCMGSPLGLLIWFGLTVALTYHLASGVRHLFWDTGEGLSVSSANRLTMLTLVVGVILAISFWMVLFASGRVVL